MLHQGADRPPKFALRFDAVLFAFSVAAPAFAPLFKLQPDCGACHPAEATPDQSFFRGRAARNGSSSRPPAETRKANRRRVTRTQRRGPRIRAISQMATR